MNVYIYALVNPISNEIFYVGRTENEDLRVRLKQHIQSRFRCNNRKLGDTIIDIFSKNCKPKITLLEVVEWKNMLREAEIIKEYSLIHPLVNIQKEGFKKNGYTIEKEINVKAPTQTA